MGWEIITSSVCGHVNAHLLLPNHLSAVQLVLNGIVIMYVPHFNGLEIIMGLVACSNSEPALYWLRAMP